MKTITLDFTNCTSYLLIHQKIKETFGFPDFYGNNLDALWDCLGDYCESPLRVLIKGIDSLPKEEREYITKDIFGVFEDLHEEEPEIIFQVVS